MFSQIMQQVVKEEQNQETINCSLWVIIKKAGGRIEVPFADIKALDGGIKVEIDRGNQKVILSTVSNEEVRQAELVEQAMREKQFAGDTQ